jgi:hypothetical protein
MAKKREEKRIEGIPEILTAAITKGQANRVPPPPDMIDQAVETLYGLLSPREVRIVDQTGESKPRKAWTSPLMMIAWSPPAGRFVVSITDKVLKVRMSVLVSSLAQLVQEVDQAVRDGKCDYRSLDK